MGPIYIFYMNCSKYFSTNPVMGNETFLLAPTICSQIRLHRFDMGFKQIEGVIDLGKCYYKIDNGSHKMPCFQSCGPTERRILLCPAAPRLWNQTHILSGAMSSKACFLNFKWWFCCLKSSHKQTL